MYVFSKISTIIFLVFCVLGCGHKKSKNTRHFHIIGILNNVTNKLIVLEESGFDVNKFVDSATIESDGDFEFSKDLKPNRLYYIIVDGARIPFITDDDKIKITGTLPDLSDIKANGSQGTTCLISFLLNFNNKNNRLIYYKYQYDSLMNSRIAANDSSIYIINKNYNIQVEDLFAYIKNFADTTTHFQAALFAVRLLDTRKEVAYFKTFSNNLKSRFPEEVMVDTFNGHLFKMISEYNKGPGVDTEAPNFTLKDKNDHDITLKEMRGKYVLLDFWASWCRPCRRENPKWLIVYQELKQYNFEMMSVSLDETKENWIRAMNEDSLTWINVNDPQAWNSLLVKLYSFEQIPANYLLDPNGIIIAKNVKPENLRQILAERLSKRQ